MIFVCADAQSNHALSADQIHHEHQAYFVCFQFLQLASRRSCRSSLVQTPLIGADGDCLTTSSPGQHDNIYYDTVSLVQCIKESSHVESLLGEDARLQESGSDCAIQLPTLTAVSPGCFKLGAE